MEKIYIVGTGPGSKDYLTPLAEKAISQADVLIGSQRLLSSFGGIKQKTLILKGNYSQAVRYIRENKGREKIAVLVSGDPGIFSFSKRIIRYLKQDEYVVIPGISSLQAAFSSIGEPWDDAYILSLHGRSKRGLYSAVLNHKKVFLFTDSSNTPSKIALFLLKKGITRRTVYVFNNLSQPNEEVIRANISSLIKDTKKADGLCVMLIKK